MFQKPLDDRLPGSVLETLAHIRKAVAQAATPLPREHRQDVRRAHHGGREVHAPSLDPASPGQKGMGQRAGDDVSGGERGTIRSQPLRSR
jgi:hypothetical protein